jgi:very-short-patch-repair endonuclease
MNKLRARQLRKHPTEVEIKLWRHLRLRQIGGYKFRRQQPLGTYIVDFVCLEKKVVVELDGGQHAEQISEDAQRTAWLESQGFHVLRFWNHQVLEEMETVKAVIYQTLLDFNPPP